MLLRVDWATAIIAVRKAMILKDAPETHCEAHTDWPFPSENITSSLLPSKSHSRASHWRVLTWSHTKKGILENVFLIFPGDLVIAWGH